METENDTTFLSLLRRIFDFRCKTLDAKERRGMTDYIDFFKKNDFKDLTEGPLVMKGIDFMGRDFIVFQCALVYSSGYTPEVNMFTVFFKRFANSDLVWHCAGHDGPILFDTLGGARLEQLKIIKTLLYDGYVDISENIIYKNNIQIKHYLLKNVKEIPIGIRLCYVKNNV